MTSGAVRAALVVIAVAAIGGCGEPASGLGGETLPTGPTLVTPSDPPDVTGANAAREAGVRAACTAAQPRVAPGMRLSPLHNVPLTAHAAVRLYEDREDARSADVWRRQPASRLVFLCAYERQRGLPATLPSCPAGELPALDEYERREVLLDQHGTVTELKPTPGDAPTCVPG